MRKIKELNEKLFAELAILYVKLYVIYLIIIRYGK